MSAVDHPPITEAEWSRGNAAFLAEALAWLRGRIAGLSNRKFEPAAEPDWPDTNGRRPALLALRDRFGLTDFEVKIILLCAGIEIDPALAQLAAQAQGDGAGVPSFSLCLALFPEAGWDSLSPHGNLRAWSLIETAVEPHRTLATTTLRIDERIVHYLKGLNELDIRLAGLLRPANTAEPLALPPSQQGVAQMLVDAWQDAEQPLPALLGTDPTSARLVAERAARSCGLMLCRMPADLLPNQPAECDAFERLWRREQRLLPIALLIEIEDSPADGPAEAQPRRLRIPPDGAIVLTAAEPPRTTRVTWNLPVARPNRAEQEALWLEYLGQPHTDLAGELAGQFTLSAPTIAGLAHRFPLDDAEPDPQPLWEAARETLRPRLDRLARRVPVRAHWDDLVLPESCSVPLKAIATQLRHRRRIHEDWGFASRTGRGLGITALFAGESGTGKTLAAEVLAATLGLDLYLVDLSGVVSKYIGETEKNLRRLFDAAEESGAILFFDEADALFGKRSEVRDSHDRYANIEVNYLLQRMEAYRGLAILATNLRSALDPAFLRRLRFVITFPYPGVTDRQMIWRRAFPAAAPLGTLDWAQLGRVNLTGGNIATVALNAAFLASAEDSAVEMRHVLEAARAELVKLDRPFRESDFLTVLPASGSVA